MCIRDCGDTVRLEESHGVAGVERAEYGWLLPDGRHTERRDRDEPDDDNRTEEAPDAVSPVFLDQKQPDEDRGGERNDVRLKQWCNDLQAFYRAQDRDRGGNHPVAIEQCRPEDTERNQ